MNTIESLVAEHDLFQGLDEGYLRLIAGCGSNVHFAEARYLFRQGEEADCFFAIREGRVALQVFVPERGPMTIQTVGAGEIVGWSWLFPPHYWQFDGLAVEPVRATVFDGACLRRKCDEDPALGYDLMKRLARVVSRRLEATLLQVLDVYGPARPR
jgi:CRP-like cAMP-binding protein